MAQQDPPVVALPPDESLRVLLVEVRRARLIELDALNRYLGEEPREPRPRRQAARVWHTEDEGGYTTS